MATFFEIDKLSLTLSERERAILAVSLLESLHAVLSDADEGIAEARRRDAEIDADSSKAISLTELDAHISGRRG